MQRRGCHADAAIIYERAAALGQKDAMNALGYMFQYGKGVTVDHAESMRWYKLAAEAGCPDARLKRESVSSGWVVYNCQSCKRRATINTARSQFN